MRSRRRRRPKPDQEQQSFVCYDLPDQLETPEDKPLIPISYQTPEKKFDTRENSIFQIDSFIQQRLESRYDNIEYLYDKLKGGTLSPYDMKNLRMIISDIETGSEILYYQLKRYPILETYKEIHNSYQQHSFVDTNNSNRKKLYEDLQEIISYFVGIAREFVDITHNSVVVKETTCDECGLQMMCTDSMSGIHVCHSCYTEKVINDDHTPVFKDVDRISLSVKHSYSKLDHIKEAVKCFQGLQTINTGKLKTIISILKRHCEFQNLETDHSSDRCITKDEVYSLLEEDQLSDHYRDINLIYRVLTGTPCPDISGILEQVYRDFETQEMVYDSMTDINRKNSLNVYYKLYKILQHNGCKYTLADFYVLKTPEVLEDHDEILKRVWEKSNWKWINT